MPKCFIIMPISTPETWIPQYGGDENHFRHVLDHLITPAVKKADLEPVPPIAQGSDVIHGEIIKNIETADIILCDMSTLNANVFFELGVRTSLNKAVSLIKDDITPKIPFDTSIVNHHTYLSSLAPWTLEDQVNKLADHIKVSLSKSDGHNSLWKYFSLSMRAEPIEQKGGVEGKLEFLSMQMDAMRGRLESLAIGRTQGPTEQELLYRELLSIAQKSGATPTSAAVRPKSISLAFERGTLTPEVIDVLENRASSAGYELNLTEGTANGV